MDFSIDNELANEFDVKDYIGKTFPTKNNGYLKILGVNHIRQYGDDMERYYVVEFINTGYKTIANRKLIKKRRCKRLFNSKCI
jgi:hypothetical protein